MFFYVLTFIENNIIFTTNFLSGTGSVILRQFSFSKNQNKLTLVQKQRWNMGGPISACVFLDAGHGRFEMTVFFFFSLHKQCRTTSCSLTGENHFFIFFFIFFSFYFYFIFFFFSFPLICPDQPTWDFHIGQKH